MLPGPTFVRRGKIKLFVILLFVVVTIAW